ncbi:BA75_01117T0 [Komagataella pastoris]|uniref:Pre-mRNA-splicing factor SLT11 n=1 Tax=Komagataella pastoris TaxID=4922 RepID=A0A1B2J8H0_PICPA|nr:BA75_01117T0 [Komagataella pastoris]
MSELPATCNNCLGENPYVEMIQEKDGRECKICTRAFTSFLWYPKNGSSIFKQTDICLTCARARNACQSCLLDLKFKISPEMRDEILGTNKGLMEISPATISANNSKIAKIYKANQLERNFQDEDFRRTARGVLPEPRVPQVLETARDAVVRLTSSTISHKALSSTSKRNDRKHQLAKELSTLLNKLPFNGDLTIPKDPDIKSMFLFGITDELSSFRVQEYFREQFNSTLEATILNHRTRCGFVVFMNRNSAEAVAESILAGKRPEGPSLIVIDRVPIRVAWGKVCNLGLNNKDQVRLAQLVKRQLSILCKTTRIPKSSNTIAPTNPVTMTVSNPFANLNFSGTEL